MSRADKIKSLETRLDALTAPKTVSLTEQLIQEELENLRVDVGNRVSTKAIESLRKDMAVLDAKINFDPIFAALSKADIENKKGITDVQKTFEKRIASLKQKDPTPNLVKQIQEVHASFQGQLAPLISKDSLLASEVDRLRQEIQRITAIEPDTSGKEALAATVELQKAVPDLEKRLIVRMSRIGNHGDHANRNIAVGGNTSILSTYTDINLKAGSNVTLTAVKNNTTKYTDITIASSGSGGGSGFQAATGTVNGVNKIFSFTNAPSAVCVDGVSIQKVSSDTTVNWTGTTAITLSTAPNFDIFGVA